MKKALLFFSLIVLFSACSKKEVKFELFSPEAFAYSMDEGFELNARTLVKGFKLVEVNKKFTAELTYTVDLKMPDGTIKKDFDKGSVKKEESQEFPELEISIQKELDSTYKTGKYFVIFNVKDENTKAQLTKEKEFDLSN